MESSNGRRERRHQIEIETAGERQPIEKLILVETVHLDEPVDRLTFAAKLQLSTHTPSDRHDPAIDARRGSPVETDLRLAHLPSSLRCGEVEIVESNRAFQLVSAVPCQEHHRRVRIGALYVLAAVRGRLRQKLNDGGLIFGLHRPLATANAVPGLLGLYDESRGSRARILATALSMVASIHSWLSTTPSKLLSAQPRQASRFVRLSVRSTISVPASYTFGRQSSSVQRPSMGSNSAVSMR